MSGLERTITEIDNRDQGAVDKLAHFITEYLFSKPSPEKLSTVRSTIWSPSSHSFTAFAGDQLAGVAVLIGSLDKRGMSYLGYIVTHPDFRGQGVGGSLLDAIEASSQVLGATGIEVDAFSTAADFFKSRGYIGVSSVERSSFSIQHLERYLLPAAIEA